MNHLHQLLMELIPAGAGRKSDRPEGQGAARDGPAPRRRRADPTPARGRPGRRPGRAGPQAQGVGQPTQDCGGRDRHHVDRHHRRRDRDRGDDPGRGRGRAPVPDPPSLATYTGVGPIEVSSGEVERHRLSRAGNRQLS
jgi:hypothetical protein